MKKLLVVMFAVVALTLTVFAQDHVELNADYMYSHLSANGNGIDADYGWDFNANLPVSKSFGVLADFSGTSAQRISLNTFGGGFQYSVRSWTSVQPYLNVKFGDARFSYADYSANKFYESVGGGLDFHVAGGLWARTGVDYLHTGLNNVGVNGVRVLAGIGYRF